MIEARELTLDLGCFKLDKASIRVGDGEYMVVIGPSGAGKTLLLECIAGLRTPSSGKIIIDRVDVTLKPPEKRMVAFVPQNYALWPHMRVWDNIAFPLKHRGFRGREVEERIEWIAGELGIKNLLDRKPNTLSGGEQQRVALARALVWDPKAVLLDEPTSALDPSLKSTAWRLIKRLHEKLGFTAIHVTHDVAEAVALADEAAFMYEGRVVKQGSIDEVLATREAAEYMGDSSIIRGVVIGFGNGVLKVRVGGETLQAVCSKRYSSGARVTLMVRPEDILLTRKPMGGSARNIVKAVVEDVDWRGPLALVTLRSVNGELKLKAYVTKSSLEELDVKRREILYAVFKAASLKVLASTQE